ncbi:helix-turn-helix transcriptional regulator [Bifidobacterium breve]|uniref:helix-turn-helix transcriptional regulator n=1 Tax=Bifidobacterium breve TaxID=1685 RepID=UPI00046CEEEA|nr:helix-turn-helix transcriptional regulator [Bifidobacterium breve]
MNQLTVAVHSIRQLSTALRDARRNAGITQTELAETTGISRPWINQLEQGRIDNPGLERVFIICDALNVRLTISYDVQTTQASHNDAADPTVITGTIDKLARFRKTNSSTKSLSKSQRQYIRHNESFGFRQSFERTSKRSDSTINAQYGLDYTQPQRALIAFFTQTIFRPHCAAISIAQRNFAY